jgi:hypothetical protein
MASGRCSRRTPSRGDSSSASAREPDGLAVIELHSHAEATRDRDVLVRYAVISSSVMVRGSRKPSATTAAFSKVTRRSRTRSRITADYSTTMVPDWGMHLARVGVRTGSREHLRTPSLLQRGEVKPAPVTAWMDESLFFHTTSVPAFTFVPGRERHLIDQDHGRRSDRALLGRSGDAALVVLRAVDERALLRLLVGSAGRPALPTELRDAFLARQSEHGEQDDREHPSHAVSIHPAHAIAQPAAARAVGDPAVSELGG